MKKWTLVIFLFIPLLGFSQKSKSKVPDYVSTKIPARDFYFRNYQFTWDSTALDDTLEIFWYQNLKSLTNKFEGCELFNPGEDVKSGNYFIPNATRFNQHVIRDFSFDYDSLIYRVSEINDYNLSLQYMPFYMKNVEVTNAEYREFVYYVRDSIARRLLAQEFPETYLKIPDDFEGDDLSTLPLNWEVEFKYYDPELMPILATMYYPQHERFYWHKQFDVSKLIFKYYEYDPGYYDGVPGLENETGNVIPHSIAIYPDTTVWINDFHFSELDPFSRLYFWHEAFDNFPVVGISHDQAIAFCIWKTGQLKNKMAKQNFPFEFEVSLPKEYEWEYVLKKMDLSNYEKNKGYFGKIKADYLSIDLDWIPDLNLNWNELFVDNADDTTVSGLRKQLNNDLTFIISDNKWRNYYITCMSGSHTINYSLNDLKKFKLNYSSMAYNVSEWMEDSFHNYQKLWEFRSGAMISDTLENHQKTFLPELIKYSNYSNHLLLTESGQLIRGSNWFDKGLPENLPFNFSYANRKDFRPSTHTHSTLGFRYVIRLKPKY